jgi:hypothetical protein
MSTPEVNELVERVRTHINDPVIIAFIKLFEIKIDEWKEAMVDCNKDTVPEFQGAIKRVRAVLDDFKRRPKKSEFKSGAYIGS